jgi:hypothetical protein
MITVFIYIISVIASSNISEAFVFRTNKSSCKFVTFATLDERPDTYVSPSASYSKGTTSSEKNFLLPDGTTNPCRIKVIGVGGGGGNAVNRMLESSLGVAGVEFWIVNTDVQALSRSPIKKRLNIGKTTSRYAIKLHMY